MNGFIHDLRMAFSSSGRVHIQLIIINVIVFLGLNVLIVTLDFIGQGYGKYLLLQFELPADLTQLLYRPWTLLTYAFWHRGLGHVFFNMVALYWFGQIFEEYLGGKRLLSLYILSALAGGVAFLLLYNLAPVAEWRKELPYTSLAGASGAIYGILVGTATLLPEYTLFLFLLGPVKIKYIALISIILSYIGLGAWNAGGNMAHLAGALMGYIFVIQLQKGNDMGAWIHNFLDWVRGIFKPKPKAKTSYTTKEKVTVNQTKSKTNAQANHQHTNKTNDTPSQQEIDAILDKISANGYDSLSKEEKEKLYKASKN